MNMEKIREELHKAAMAVVRPHKVSRLMEAGSVAAAIESSSGTIYVGVCVDTACTLEYARGETRCST